MSLGEKDVALRARGFCFAYTAAGGAAGSPGDAPLLGPLDWEVPAGSFVLLTGATGSGKTTLLRSFVPALAPAGERSGELEVAGRPAGKLDPREAATLVGYVSQNPDTQAVCDSVWHELAFGLENLGVPQADMRRRVAEVAHFFGIEPWFHRQTAELSGGQRQVLALAATLALCPQVLLLDEPTAQLDPVAEKNFLHALFRVNRELGLTVAVATHAPEAMADYATAAVELAGGRLVAREPEVFVARPLELGPSRQGASDAPVAVRLRDAYVRYGRADGWVLRGCDLSVRRGSVHALVGGNASGKSTLLRTVAGVLSAERGRVENGLVRSQALLPQDPKALFVCDTVAEELREWQPSCGYADADVAEVVARLGLAGSEGTNPLDLSGGQQQLLALAKLLLTRPSLLLLDEPTKGLDAPSCVALARAVMREVDRGVTVLVATHDLAFCALLADEVTLLFDGQDACTQPAGEFFAHNLFYRPCESAFARAWRGQGAAS